MMMSMHAAAAIHRIRIVGNASERCGSIVVGDASKRCITRSTKSSGSSGSLAYFLRSASRKSVSLYLSFIIQFFV